MIFTLIAIICVAIAGTAGADPTTGDRSGGQSRAGYQFFSTFYNYSCDDEIRDYMSAQVMPNLTRCMVQRWPIELSIPEMTASANTSANSRPGFTFPSVLDALNISKQLNQFNQLFNTDMGCCRYYDTYGIVKAQIHNKCTKIGGKNTEQDMKGVCNDVLNGQQLDDKYCKSLKGRREMSPDCKKRIDELASSADSHRPSTSVSVLLAAIVVSIAVSIYAF